MFYIEAKWIRLSSRHGAPTSMKSTMKNFCIKIVCRHLEHQRQQIACAAKNTVLKPEWFSRWTIEPHFRSSTTAQLAHAWNYLCKNVVIVVLDRFFFTRQSLCTFCTFCRCTIYSQNKPWKNAKTFSAHIRSSASIKQKMRNSISYTVSRI